MRMGRSNSCSAVAHLSTARISPDDAEIQSNATSSILNLKFGKSFGSAVTQSDIFYFLKLHANFCRVKIGVQYNVLGSMTITIPVQNNDGAYVRTLSAIHAH